LAASGVGCKDRKGLLFRFISARGSSINSHANGCTGRMRHLFSAERWTTIKLRIAGIQTPTPSRSYNDMKPTTLIFSLGLALTLSTSFAADKEKPATPTPTPVSDKTVSDKISADTVFIKKAAEAGMAEVEVGKVAEKNGQREDVKTFASLMVKDHGKANENLKSVAAKMNATLPEKLRPKRQFKIDKISKLSGADFDNAYIITMVQDHVNTIAGFEKARAQVSNEDLKKFIDDTLPVLKEHLEMAKKMQSAK
jgi:putative membrane protein